MDGPLYEGKLLLGHAPAQVVNARGRPTNRSQVSKCDSRIVAQAVPGGLR
jgi:hypothetical protein